MKYDTWQAKLLGLCIPLAIYLLIGLSFASTGEYSLQVNLLEKLVAAIIFGYLFFKDNKRILWRKPKRNIRSHILLYLAAAVLAVSACIAINCLFEVSGFMTQRQQEVETMSQALYNNSFWMEFLVLVIAAPLGEEMLFRGVLFRRMRTWLPFLGAAMISSLLFALFHGNIIQGLYGFLMGFLFAWGYEKLRSVIAAVWMHACANLVSLILTELVHITAGSIWIFLIAGSAVSVAALYLIILLTKETETEGEHNEIINNRRSKL